jgi:hypothetical protein
MMRCAARIAFVLLLLVPHPAHSATKPAHSATKKSASAHAKTRGRPEHKVAEFHELRADQDLYRREYVKRRAFPDSVLDFIPAALRRHWRFDSTIVGRLRLGESALASVPCQWTTIGPTNAPGRVTDMAVTQIPSSAESRVFVTTVGGVWRSTDSGRSWERVTDGLKAGVFGAVAVTPRLAGEPDEVFIGGGDPDQFSAARAGGPGLWHSVDGGTTWTHITSDLDDAVIFRIRIDPSSPHNVYVASSDGVYSADRTSGALTFQRHAGFDAPTSDIVAAFPPQVPSLVLYAGAYGPGTMGHRGIWKCTGSTGPWTWASNGFGNKTPGIEAIRLAIAPSNPRVLYAKISANTVPTESDRTHNSELLGIYKTTVGGEGITPGACGNAWCNIFTDTGTNLNDSESDSYHYDWYNGALLVDPNNPDKVFVGNKGLFWTDAMAFDDVPWFGAQNSQNLAFSNANANVHDDVHALAFDPSTTTDPAHPTLWVGDDGGVHRSTPQDSEGNFQHWEARAHGMTTTEFLGIGAQQGPVTPLLGGTQDNGTTVTYGNRTWYAQRRTDGAEAGFDAANRATVFGSANRQVKRFPTIVPGMTKAWKENTFAGTPKPVSPFAVDDKLDGRVVCAALAGGVPCLIKTDDGGRTAPTTLASIQVIPNVTMDVSCVAIAPSTASCGAGDFHTFYVGLISADGETPTSTILATHDGGTTWTSPPTGLPLLSPNGIAVDRCDPQIAFAAFGGERGQAGRVFVTEDGGNTWTDLPFPGGAQWPPTPVTDVAVDPTPRGTNPEIIYITTALGVCRGLVALGATPTATWQHFNQGLPQSAPELSVDATSIEAHVNSRTLVIGTLGYGAFQRDVSDPDVRCQSVLLSVRDNVFDRGEPISPNNIADPEHPECVTTDCEEYKPADSPGAMLHWWASPDIRIDTPCELQPPGTCTADPIAPTGDLDPVQVESCPTNSYYCDAGLMRDHVPEPGKKNRVYIQVTNRGLQTAHSLRVYAMWTDATTTVPLLPSDFWSQTFPAPGVTCHALTETTGWHPFEPFNSADPCASLKTIRILEPGKSAVVHYDWQAPSDLPAHSCIIAMVDGNEDAIPATTRAELRPWVLVPNNHQIGQRNLHLADIDTTMLRSVSLIDSLTLRGLIAGLQDLVIARGGLTPADTLSILLPTMAPPLLDNILRVSTGLTLDERALARALDLDSTVVYRVGVPGGRIRNLSVPSGNKMRIGVRYALKLTGSRPQVPRFTIMARQDTTVLGGSTYVTRFRHH